ncbi:MAG TPA: sensor histidine kinase [Acidimicrobiales bacterium]|nr:sensor histidine kinase [Acidimicrobiales bacterium]HWI03022.1 sensor histidine kinase [Acidimicrobiales bacterium]
MTRSILFKVVAALVIALAVSGIVTAVVASRLTSEALDGQAERTARSHLSVLQEAYSHRERTLVVNTRNLAEALLGRGLLDPSRRPELIAELGRAKGNLELDLLRVLDAGGRDLAPAVGLGATLAAPSDAPDERVSLEPATRLLRTTQGRFVQAVPVALGSGPNRLILIAGQEFQDPFAYRLRQQIGSLDHVVLVAGGEMAGSTLPEPPAAPPAQDGDTRAVPRVPAMVSLGGTRSLVAYTAVSRSVDAGAIGVVLTDPTAALDRSLSQTRLVSALLSALVALGLGWLLFRAIIRPLSNLAATAGQVAGGDARASFRVGGDDEIATLAGSLEHMRAELQARLGTIAAQAEELRESSRRIVAAQDGERHRLARDLHDGLQQQLVVLRMQVGMLEDGDEEVGRLGQQLDTVIEQLREVTHDLYPSILVDRGLTAALHSYVGRLPVSVRLTCTPEDFPRLPVELESGAYFLLGEAVTNALKHSGAETIELGLTVADGWLHVSVVDDGEGFVVEQSRRRGGLLHMEDRVRSFGGTLEITSAPGEGTGVVAGFPLRVEIPAS